VITLSLRALKMHGGVGSIRPGKPLPPEILEENLPAVERGSQNLAKQIENVTLHGVPAVVAINRFAQDTEAEVALVRGLAVAAGAQAAVCSTVWAQGGAGGEELAEAVVAACRQPNNFHYLYPDQASIKEKIETIATRIYGAEGVDYTPLAEERIARYTAWGLGELPICMAKTHLSLTDDPARKGRPTGFRVTIRDLRPSAGAGFLYPLLGEMATMPGLPSVPVGTRIDIDEQGNTVGLS